MSCVDRPLTSPVTEDLWVEGNGPGSEVDPANDDVDDGECFVMNHSDVNIRLTEAVTGTTSQ